MAATRTGAAAAPRLRRMLRAAARRAAALARRTRGVSIVGCCAILCAHRAALPARGVRASSTLVTRLARRTA